MTRLAGIVEEAEPVMKQLKDIFERYKPAPNEKEAQTEEDWVRPVLRTVGHADDVRSCA